MNIESLPQQEQADLNTRLKTSDQADAKFIIEEFNNLKAGVINLKDKMDIISAQMLEKPGAEQQRLIDKLLDDFIEKQRAISNLKENLLHGKIDSIKTDREARIDQELKDRGYWSKTEPNPAEKGYIAN
jgi:hypothetical protein